MEIKTAEVPIRAVVRPYAVKRVEWTDTTGALCCMEIDGQLPGAKANGQPDILVGLVLKRPKEAFGGDYTQRMHLTPRQALEVAAMLIQYAKDGDLTDLEPAERLAREVIGPAGNEDSPAPACPL